MVHIPEESNKKNGWLFSHFFLLLSLWRQHDAFVIPENIEKNILLFWFLTVFPFTQIWIAKKAREKRAV
jgi:hypothetical protein